MIKAPSQWSDFLNKTPPPQPPPQIMGTAGWGVILRPAHFSTLPGYFCESGLRSRNEPCNLRGIVWYGITFSRTVPDESTDL